MDKKVKIAISSAGGYGYFYLRSLLDDTKRSNFEIVSVFDPNIRSLPIFSELVSRVIPCTSDYNIFLESLNGADLAIIVSPIHYHSSQSIDALARGCNVLLDKPLAGNIGQVKQIAKSLDISDNWLMVGYQWTYSEAIQKLKKDLINRKYGEIIKAKTLVFWPRGYDYYARNNWAGVKRSSDDMAVNDSLLNNAMAHFIHNLLYLCGDEQDTSADTVSGVAELYRAYQIETFDTAILLLQTKKGQQIGFYGSHVTKNPKGPLFLIECEEAAIYYGELSNDIVAVRNDGSTETYGDPEASGQFNKLWLAIDRCQGISGNICTLEAAEEQTKVIDALEQVRIGDFAHDLIKEDQGERKYVEGLGYMLLSSYQQWAMPSDQKFTIKGTKQEFII